MKKIILLTLSASFYLASFAQEKIDSCKCFSEAIIKAPDVAEEEEREGTVIIEFETDSTCISGNPIIIQSLGAAYDKEALRCINEIIVKHNKCIKHCKFPGCTKTKQIWPISFKKAE